MTRKLKTNKIRNLNLPRNPLCEEKIWMGAKFLKGQFCPIDFRGFTILNRYMTLTIHDLDEIEKVVDKKIEERTKNLPTKEEFFDREDKIMGELKVVREEITILSGLNRKVNNHEDRIGKVEKKLGIQPAI